MPVPSNLEEDGRTSAFLANLPGELLIVDRRHLIPVGQFWRSRFSYVGPVTFQSKRFALKEPAVSA